jgi:hypothetical protein
VNSVCWLYEIYSSFAPPRRVALLTNTYVGSRHTCATSPIWRLLQAGALILLTLSPAFGQTALTQEQLKDRIISRVDALAEAVVRQANGNAAVADKLSKAPPGRASTILNTAIQVSDPSIASVAPKTVPSGPRAGTISGPISSTQKNLAVTELKGRSEQLTDYAKQLTALGEEIRAAPGEEALTKLRQLAVPPKIAQIVFDPLGDRLPSTPGRIRQINAAAGPDHGSTPFIVGSGDASVDFPSVGAVIYRNSQGDLVTGCTGTLIASNVVLTAAHCINLEDTAQTIHSPFGVFFQHAGFHTVDTGVPPVQYEGYSGDSFGDIALIFLTDPIFEIKPAILNATGRVKPGSITRIVGFGYHNLTGTSGVDSAVILEKTGIKIWGHVTTDVCQGRSLICWTYAKKPVDESFGSTCYGDSGGPLFSLFNGNWLLAGVTRGSLTNKPCEPGDRAIDVELFDFVAWIKKMLALHPTSGTMGPWQPLNPLDNDENARYAVEVTDSIFQPANPSFSKMFSLNDTSSLVRIALNTTPRDIGANVTLHLDVGRQGTDPVCNSDNTDTFISCDLPTPLSPGGNWIVQASGGSGQEFQIVATVFDATQPTH